MIKKLILSLALMSMSVHVLAAGGVVTDAANINLSSNQSLQNGAKLFVNYCMACHTAKYMRYGRLAQDLELTEEQVLAGFTFNPDAKIGDLMTNSASTEDQTAWFVNPPPDLSVISRVRGKDWLYTFLRAFYKDESRPLGWGNTVMTVNMPNPLWSLQGVQVLEKQQDHAAKGDASGHGPDSATAHLALSQPGLMSPEEFDDAINDLVTFLVYLGEPAQLERKSLGWKVLLYLSLFTFLAYLLKVEYWRDVH